MSILSSTHSGMELTPITAGILEKLGWVFHKHQNCWDHWEYTNVEIYQETSFRKEVKEKRGLIPDNWYAKEYIPSIVVGLYGSINKTIVKTIPLNCVGDLELLENHKVIKKYSI